MNYKESISSEALYESMWKCRRGKMWKASVARYVLHGIDETLRLEEELESGKYMPRKPHTFTLTYPKERPCSSTHIRDRIVQRSLNDNVIYPAMTNGFIWDNMACQKGKGTTKAMDRIDHLLHRYFINHGSNEGWVFQTDIHGYYRNMEHVLARRCFAKHLDDETVSNAMKWLQRQYPYEVGYEPGSQMVQILGISFLDAVDHYAKERLRCAIYIRYMDDFFIVSDSREFLEQTCKPALENELEKVHLEMHPKKTKIYPLTKGIKILGFTFHLTKTGKVIRIIDPSNVKHEIKKLFRMAQLVQKGIMTRRKYEECYTAWKAHANQGNSFQMLQRMTEYKNRLLAA